jgi:hypothetical protein
MLENVGECWRMLGNVGKFVEGYLVSSLNLTFNCKNACLFLYSRKYCNNS